MAINLPDLPHAVNAYLDTKVKVTVRDIHPSSGSGTVINPNDTFTFNVHVANASAANGGVALTNLRYQVSIHPATGSHEDASIQVPSGRTAIDGSGHPIGVGTFVKFFTFNPSGDVPSYLDVGGVHAIQITGKASPGAAGGNAIITANIQADPDINALFPRNGNSTGGTETVTAVPI